MTWRDKIDSTIKTHVEALIKETAKEKEALIESSDPKISQLWLAIGILSKQNFDLRLRTKYLESALKEMLKSPKTGKKSTKTSKKEQDKVNEILKSLSKF